MLQESGALWVEIQQQEPERNGARSNQRPLSSVCDHGKTLKCKDIRESGDLSCSCELREDEAEDLGERAK